MGSQETSGAAVAGEPRAAAGARAAAFVLGFAAPVLVAFGSRWLMAHAEKVARDTAPLLLLLVFAAFTALALRLLPGRRWQAVGLLCAGAALGTAAEVLLGPDPGRRLMLEVLVMGWLAAPAVAAGILLEQVWRRKRRAP